MKNIDPNIKCFNCGYKWHTRSDLHFVSCPSCLQKVFVKVVETKGGK